MAEKKTAAVSTVRKTVKAKEPNIVEIDPGLKPFVNDLNMRIDNYKTRKKRLLGTGRSLRKWAAGHEYYGLHKTKTGWVYREWAPHAEAMHLVGDFNGWDRLSHPMTKITGGNWEIVIDGVETLPHLSHYKVAVTHNGVTEDRLPLYVKYCVQDVASRSYTAVVWNPGTEYRWCDKGFTPGKNIPPFIYECHVGMATEEYKVGTYAEFDRNVLPRIKRDGYNTIQMMAIMEHPYYGSFGYQVSNFFAASSRYGTPDELKALIDHAHQMGITVLLDLVHSHAVKNTAEGINMFDGTVEQFFKPGAAGDHPAWGSKVFDYGNDGVVHFLLSNLRFWMEEYHFDGFRFDGVTSMLYHDHALGSAFMNYSQYFSLNTDVDAVSYLMLATDLIHEIKPDALCIAEDMSGMPGMCLPIADGGIGFDYRLGMGLPDFFIKTIKERSFGNWEMGKMYYELTSRRPGEKSIAYAESHDQALVGDQTIIFRLCGAEMYTAMRCDSNSMVVNSAVALHKMIRLVTAAAGGDGYLNFMGNEFGHPEWIDFPREGNGWSHHYARRQWSLAENIDLRYHLMGRFDKEMIELIKGRGVLNDRKIEHLRDHQTDQILCFKRGGLIFVFNFHPSNPQTGFFIGPRELGDYRVILSTDEGRFGGMDRISKEAVYHTWAKDPQHGDGFAIYLPPQTACVLEKIPVDAK